MCGRWAKELLKLTLPQEECAETCCHDVASPKELASYYGEEVALEFVGGNPQELEEEFEELATKETSGDGAAFEYEIEEAKLEQEKEEEEKSSQPAVLPLHMSSDQDVREEKEDTPGH